MSLCLMSILSVIFLFCPGGNAADWVYYTKDNVGNYKFYDRSSISFPSNGIVSVWKKDVYSSEGIKDYVAQRARNNLSTYGYNELSHVLCKEELSCKTREYRVLACSMYDNSGSVLESQSAWNGHRTWEPIVPGSETDVFRKVLCAAPQKKVRKRK